MKPQIVFFMCYLAPVELSIYLNLYLHVWACLDFLPVYIYWVLLVFKDNNFTHPK